jgi:putative FmdB family regulatory protein
MPTYEYRCETGHLFEVTQRMADGPLEACTICGAPVQRVFHPVAVHFKGSGFYNTDYGKQKKGGGSDGSSSGGDSGSSDSSSKESKGSDSKGSDSKGSDSKGSSDSKSSDSKTKASSGD